MKKQFFLISGLSFTIFSHVPLMANLVFHEGFDYAIGQNVTVVSAWDQIPLQNAEFSVVSGLEFGSLHTSGNAIQKTAVGSQGRITIAAPNLIQNAGSQFFMSFIVQETNSGGISTFNFLGADWDFGFGARFGTNLYSARTNTNTAPTPDLANTFPVGETFLIIAMAEFDYDAIENLATNRQSSAWIFDNSVSVEALLNLDALDALSLYGRSVRTDAAERKLDDAITINSNANASVIIDELRLGTSLESVIPIPEPKSFAWLTALMAVVGVVYTRRRMVV